MDLGSVESYMSCRSESTNMFSLRLLCYRATRFLIAALLVAFHPVSSSAQVEWTPEAQISLDDVYDDWFPRVAAGPDGRVWVVWRGIDGYDPEIMHSVNDGNGWSYPARVNTDDYVEDTSPDIAVGPDGNPWVVWSKRVGGSSKLFWSTWEGDGWRYEERVFPDSANEPYVGGVHIAVGPNSIPWLVLPWYVAGGRAICTSRCEGDAWTWPDTVVCLPGQAECRPAAGAGGDLWVVIRNVVNDEPRVLYTYREGGCWAPVNTIPGVLEMPRSVVVSPDGELWIAWDSDGVVWAARYWQDEWAEPEMVVAPDTIPTGSGVMRACCPDLAVSTNRLLWATWREYYFGVGESNSRIYASRRGLSGWTSKEQVSSSDGFAYGYHGISLSPGGEAWVVWQAWDGRDYEILHSHSVGNSVAEILAASQGPLLVWTPNPMRERGILRSRSSVAIRGQVFLYDIGGHLVRRLGIPTSAASASSRISWDGRDSFGRLVSPGSYVWQAQTGGQLYEGTVVIIR
jgi:hypothetical protein